MDALRSALQPITHSLPAPVQNLGISLLGATCYKTLLHDIDLSSTECIKLAISKGLGIVIIASAAVVKVPQILKLLKARSASGVSFLAYLLETSAYLISFAYNVRQGFPFSTYGETSLILVQNAIISVLVLHYTGRQSTAALFVAGLAASAVTLLSKDILDTKVLSYLQAGAGLLSVSSKLPQIFTIWQQGGTGQLSAYAVFNYLIGTILRIYTTLQEVDDKLILYNFIAGFVLNAVLAAQMAWYWNAPTKKATPSKGKKKGRVAAAPASSPSQTTATPKGKSPTTRRRG